MKSLRACLHVPTKGALLSLRTPPPTGGPSSPPPNLLVSCFLTTLFCLCYLCLLLTAGPSLAAPSSEDYPIIPLAQHVLPSSRAISSSISLSFLLFLGLDKPGASFAPSLARHRLGQSSVIEMQDTRAGRDLCICPSAEKETCLR